jgi:hypothetical protein
MPLLSVVRRGENSAVRILPTVRWFPMNQLHCVSDGVGYRAELTDDAEPGHLNGIDHVVMLLITKKVNIVPLIHAKIVLCEHLDITIFVSNANRSAEGGRSMPIPGLSSGKYLRRSSDEQLYPHRSTTKFSSTMSDDVASSQIVPSWCQFSTRGPIKKQDNIYVELELKGSRLTICASLKFVRD